MFVIPSCSHSLSHAVCCLSDLWLCWASSLSNFKMPFVCCMPLSWKDCQCTETGKNLDSLPKSGQSPQRRTFIFLPPLPSFALPYPTLPYPTFSVLRKGVRDKVFPHFLYSSLAEVEIILHFTGSPQHPERSFQ